jgi:hypothetical protein
MHEMVLGSKKKAAASGWTFDPTFKGSGVTLTNSNQRADITGFGGAVLGTTGYNKGKRYFEVKATQFERGDVAPLIGFSNRNSAVLTNCWAANTNQVVWYSFSGGMFIYKSDLRQTFSAAFSQGGILGLGMDFDSGTFQFYFNGAPSGLKNIADYVNSVAGPFYPLVGSPATTSPIDGITDINPSPLYLPASFSPW